MGEQMAAKPAIKIDEINIVDSNVDAVVSGFAGAERSEVNFLAIATDLIKRGFSVIPIEPHGKKTIFYGG